MRNQDLHGKAPDHSPVALLLIDVINNFDYRAAGARTSSERSNLSRDDARGKPIAELLAPCEEDYFVLKPKHSGFFSTSLDLLLTQSRGEDSDSDWLCRK